MGDGRVEVLYLAPWVDLGGSDKGTIDWFAHLDKSRFAPSLITTQHSPNRWVHRVEPHAEEVWTLPDIMAGDSFPSFIIGFVESRGVEVVHIMNSRLGFELLPDLAALPNPPVVVVQMHAEEPGHGGYVSYVSTRYAGLIDAFSVSSTHLEQVVRSYDVPAQKIKVIYTGVDADGEFSPTKVRPRPDVKRSEPVILWPGRLVEQKDPMLSLQVMRELCDRDVTFTMEIVGDGLLRGAVLDRAGELGIGDRLRLNPPSQDMASWYRSSDLMLMTSLFEGVPYVILEAMAMGVPIVAPALPGNVEVMDEDAGVLIYPRDDVGAYADAVQQLLLPDAPRERMAERSRTRVLSSFTLDSMARRHEALYDELLGRRTCKAESNGCGYATHDAAVGPDSRPLRLPRAKGGAATAAVIVPCYRHGRYLAACVGSIRAQTRTASQIIVVDDASDDDETIRALELLEQAGDVEVLRLDVNSGPCAARNRALELVHTDYVLPLDADDLLLPEALETMVGQLAGAPEDVAFVYPHAQHFGNRHDYVEMPDFNLFLLTLANFCPAASLFDRRVFDEGVRYPEDLATGHEDWDLVMQIVACGLIGVPADGRTFLYRKRGFSRVDAAHLGSRPFAEVLESRHPEIYGRIEEIKAAWAPALSLITVPSEDVSGAEFAASLRLQTSRDLEVVAARDNTAWWLAEAIRQARADLVAVVSTEGAALLRRRDAVEKLIRAHDQDQADSLVVLRDVPGTPPYFALVPDEDAGAGRPVLVSWRRSRIPPVARFIPLGDSPDLLEDLAAGLEESGLVHWRAAGVAP